MLGRLRERENENMVSRFTQKAQKALEYAIIFASEMGHTYIGSEHILLGLAKDPDATASKLLQSKGIKIGQLEESVAACDGIGTKTRLSPGDMTPKAKRIIEASAALASRVGDSQIGTEHILLAILGESSSVAVQLLLGMSVGLGELRSEALSLLANGDGKPDESKKSVKIAPEKKSAIKDLPSLSHYGRDLTLLAKEGKIDPIIGRETETARVIQILCRRQKNNPCLIGEPGVGKTAVVEGLAKRIAEGRVPDILQNKMIITLDIAAMIAGAKYRGEFEDRLKNVIEEVRKNPEIVLFIDEIHTIVGAGAAEGAVDAANILKPALARGEMQVIGATTIGEFRKYIEKDGALERRFQSVTVGEPTEQETIRILEGLKEKYEKHHRLTISDEAIATAVKLSVRYLCDRFLPDKAIDLLDEAGAKRRILDCTSPENLQSLEEELKSTQKKKEEAVLGQRFEAAAKLRDKEKTLKKKIEEEKAGWQQQSQDRGSVLLPEHIAEVVTLWTGVPVQKLAEEEHLRLSELPGRLKARVVGQDDAIEKLAKAIQRGRVGLKDPRRPVGSFLFLGPTGVGKTELCKALSEVMFGTKQAMIRLDMSEYMEKHSVAKLIGAPPGYVGFDEGGQLTEQIRRKPYSVVLFDEIEKAHPDVCNLLLQVLEDGRLTDAQGRTADFKNAVVIMTSNVGATAHTPTAPLGFSSQTAKQETEEKARALAKKALKNTFRPEFLNRIDEIIVFERLSEESLREIARLMLKEIQKRSQEIGISLHFTDEAIGYIAKAGQDPLFGARPIRRTVTHLVEDGLSQEILEGNIQQGDEVLVDAKQEKITFTKTKTKNNM